MKNLINGKLVESRASSWLPVHDPATGRLVALTPESTPAELREASDGAQEAFRAWREVPVQQRARVNLRLQALIRDERNTEALAAAITREQGKTLGDARGDVFRGLEVVEHACSVGTLTMGETLSNLSAGVDSYSLRQPLGVAAGICPCVADLFSLPLHCYCSCRVLASSKPPRPRRQFPAGSTFRR